METAKQTTLDLQQYMDFLSRHIEEHRIRSRSFDIVESALHLKAQVPLRNFFEAQVFSFLQDTNGIEAYQPDYVSRVILELANRICRHLKENSRFILQEILLQLEEKYPRIAWEIQNSEVTLASILGSNGSMQVAITLPSALSSNYWGLKWSVSRLENLRMGGADLWYLLEYGFQAMVNQANFEMERIQKDRDMLAQFLGVTKK